MSTSKYYIGIDLGLKGAIIVIEEGKIILKRVMPIIGKEVDTITLYKMLKPYMKLNVHVVLEKFGGFFGYAKKAAVSLGSQSGCVIGLLKLMQFKHTCYMPPQWQKVMFEGTTAIMKKGKNAKGKDNKAMALVTVSRLFPGESFLATARCTKPHDGMIDALLLAEFGRRKNL